MQWTDDQLFDYEMRMGAQDRRRGETREGVERRGKEVQHMASFSQDLSLYVAHLLDDRPGHFVVNITLHCFAFGCCYNTRSDDTLLVPPRHNISYWISVVLHCETH